MCIFADEFITSSFPNEVNITITKVFFQSQLNSIIDKINSFNKQYKVACSAPCRVHVLETRNRGKKNKDKYVPPFYSYILRGCWGWKRELK